MSDDQRFTSHRTSPGSPSATEAAAQAWSRLAELARASLATQASLTRKSVDLAWSSLAGDLDRASANRAYAESVMRESTRYWRTVGELGFEYAGDLVTLGKSVTTSVLRTVATAGRRQAPGIRLAPLLGPWSRRPSRSPKTAHGGSG